MQQLFRHLDRRLSVSLQRLAEGRYEAVVDEQPRQIEVSPIGAAELQIICEGRTHVLHVARVGGTYQVAIGGEVYVLTPETAGASTSTAALASPQIASPMPGKVLQVLVAEGNEVNAGDGLIILEAMKMENRIVAEAPALVRKVHVRDGEMVDGGRVLIELEYREEPRS